MPNPEFENPHQEITAEEVMTKARDGYRYHVSVQKEHLRPSKLEDSINQECSDLSQDQKETLINFCKKYSGRIPIHLYRLLGNGRSETEKKFAEEFIQSYDPIIEKIKEVDQKTKDSLSEEGKIDLLKDRVLRTLSGNNADAAVFWTFAPYIFKYLKEKNHPGSVGIQKLISWAETKETSKEILDQSNETNLHLSGMRDLYADLGHNYYFLNIDPNDVTHKFTDQEAKKLVESGLFDNI